VSTPIDASGDAPAPGDASGPGDYAPHEVAWTPEKVARLWDFYASGEAFHGTYFSAHSGAAIVKEIDAKVGFAGKRILDYGCGRGDLLAHLVGRGATASGLEFSDESARIARERLAGKNGFGEVVAVSDLPSSLPSESFDVVLMIEIIEHLLEDQLESTFDEVRRLLAPGGLIVLTTPNEEPIASRFVHCPDCGATFHRWQHMRSLDTRSGAALLARHGFEPRIAEGTFWGLSRMQRFRHTIRSRDWPHLLLVGARPST
jgi:SAM-dependent methyltransferase